MDEPATESIWDGMFKDALEYWPKQKIRDFDVAIELLFVIPHGKRQD